MRKDRAPDPETPMGEDPATHEPQAPSTANPVYNADLTKEEEVLLATLGIRNPTTGAIVPIKAVAGVLARMLQKMREQAIEATHENKDSLELSRNAKGEYAYKIKVYFDAWGKIMTGVAVLDALNEQMLARYIQKPEVKEK